MDAALVQWASGLTTGISQMAAAAFVAGLWQGLLLAAATWACLRMLPRTPAAVRFAVWSAVFALSAALPFLHAENARAQQALATHAALFHFDVRWTFVIAALWAVLSLVRAARLAASGVRLHSIWKRAIPVAMPPMTAGVSIDGITLCTSSDVDRPSVIGFLSPRILIPAGLIERLSPPELEQIILHELGHLRRRDDWINLAQKFALVLFPLNPALVWIERRLCLERELACDDAVLRHTRAPKAYARCLTSLAEKRLERHAAALSLGAWERRSELGRRIHSILRSGTSMGRIQSRVVMGTLVLALMGGATELARCPRIVSFANEAPVTQAANAILPPEYHPALATEQSTAHEVLLKASAPAAVLPAVHRQPKHTPRPRLETVRKTAPRRPSVQQWVVMTSWSSTGATGITHVSKMVFTVPAEYTATPAYAAVPIMDGWLVLQL